MRGADLVHGDDLRDVVDDDLPLLLRRPVAVLGAARLQPLWVLLLGAVDQHVVPVSKQAARYSFCRTI